jgi:hypothetical protein
MHSSLADRLCETFPDHQHRAIAVGIKHNAKEGPIDSGVGNKLKDFLLDDWRVASHCCTEAVE